MLNITSGLCLCNAYNFFVVSYGNESSTVLPSNHSDTANVTLCEWMIFFRSAWLLYLIANTTIYPSTVTVTVNSTTSYEGSCPISDDSNTATVTLCEWIVDFRSSWPLYLIANTTKHCPVITMTTTDAKCQSSTSGLTITVSSISLIVLVITGIIITALVLVVIIQHRKIQLLRYICH